MDQVALFLEMGGYAAYVWPAFAVTALGLGGLLAMSLRSLRARERALESAGLPPRRRAAARAVAATAGASPPDPVAGHAEPRP